MSLVYRPTGGLGPGALGGFTRRSGGRSRGPYRALNLGDHVGDDPADVAANRTTLSDELGVPVVYLQQVHSARVVVLSHADTAHPPRRADAAVTREPGLGLAIMTADCAPVLLHDPTARVIAAAHVGRAGLAAGVLPATLVEMERLGAAPHRVHAAIGPTICGRCYEVPEPLAADTAAIVPAARATTRHGTPSIDIPAGARAQLQAAGVTHVSDEATCTYEERECFSYRRQGSCGRQAGVIAMVAM